MGGLPRAEALRPLSRRHQQVLLHARELKWRARYLREGSPGKKPDAVAAFLAFHHAHAEPHFRAEEEILLPAILDRAPDGHPSIDRLHEAHAAIRAAVARLAASDAPPPALIEDVSSLLTEHVRDEERTLFPFAEEVLGPDGLAEIEAALDAHVL